MCESPRNSSDSGAFARGRREIRTGRRTLLTAGAAAVAISSLPRAAAAAADTRRRAYVLVLDGCRPDEITPILMPRTSALREGGA